MSELEWKSLCLELARHLRNTDDLEIHRWGVVSMDLLAKVRAVDPAAYDAQVKGEADAEIERGMDAGDDESSALERAFI